MNPERTVDPSDILAPYRRISPLTPIGAIGVAQCVELEADTGALGPGARYDHAWVKLEHAVALAKDINPVTNKRYQPHIVRSATVDAQKAFADLHEDESVPPVLRAQARLAKVCVPQYRDVAIRQHKFPGPNFVPYLRALQTAAAELLDLDNYTEDEVRVLRAMTGIAILSEYMADDDVFLLASPRQPWHISRYNKIRIGAAVPIVIGERAPRGGVHVSPDALEYAQLESNEIAAPFVPLKAYLRYPVAFHKNRSALPVFNGLVEQIYGSIQPGTEVLEEPVAQAEDVPLSVEALWYMTQSSYDLESMPVTTLKINMLTLEERFKAGELPPREQHMLGWMHMDYARLLAEQAQRKGQIAQSERMTASRVSRLEAPMHEGLAAAATLEAEQLLGDVGTYFDAAEAIFDHVATEIQNTHAGEYYEVILDKEATPAYKALFTHASNEELDRIVTTYMKHLALLESAMRHTEGRLKKIHDDDQLLALHTAAARITCCLLTTSSTDEAARHLVLPTSVRAGGSRGEIDLIAYPINVMSGGYDVDTPAYIFVEPENSVRQDGREVTVGENMLIPPTNTFGLLKRIAAVTRNQGKQVRARKSNRGADIDAAAQAISDAIVDASES